MTLVRLEAPETRRTAPRRTPNESATAASAASVAWPSTARALTRTIRAPSCSPPTPGRGEPGFTRIVTRMPVLFPVAATVVSKIALLGSAAIVSAPFTYLAAHITLQGSG
jgi:hypothetical protein